MSTDKSSWHAVSSEAAVDALGANPEKGLSTAQAAQILAEVGPNEIPKSKRDPAWKIFLTQFTSPLVLTLLGAAVVATVAKATQSDPEESAVMKFADAGAILAIVVLNAIFGFLQEQKAGKSLDSLQAMLVFNARVVRDGMEHIIPSRDVVPGDIVVVEAGDQVPADVRLVHAADFQTDESPLTGESMPVEKDASRVLDSATSLADRVNMAFMGTTATRGRAHAVVVATAGATEIGHIGKVIGEIVREETPLEKRLATFSRQILVACLVISIALFAVGLARHEMGTWELLLVAVALAVAAIPEGLPAVTTITLALGMQRMAKRGALIRSLPAVETLGSATVICTDKTGTLTLNDMQVRELATLRCSYRLGGGWKPGEGEIVRDGQHVKIEEDDGLRRLVRTSVVPNHVALKKSEDGQFKGEGDPTEVAIVLMGARVGVFGEGVLGVATLAASNPFDSDRRRMSLVYRDATSGECTSYVKGGVEEILSRCTQVMDTDGPRPINSEDHRELTDRAMNMAERALRVLAVASRRGDAIGAEEAETDLEFLGLVGMQDPPRPEAIGAIRECKEAGIRVVMITGDHAVTARAIAREMGMWEKDDVALTGAELERISDEELARIIPKVRIFARVTAEQKLRIIRAWKADGGVVAMTGDGVNDAPALREADIGVAMGKRGTDVAREAAKMVLTDDNFASIVHAVSEGRTILRNIRKSVVFLLSSNVGLVVTVIASAFIPGALVLVPLQLLWINLVTNGAPALGLGVDPPEPDHMRRRPSRVGGLLDREDALFIAGFGLVMGVVGIAMYVMPESWLPAAVTDKGARTLVFAFLAFAPLFHAFNCRERRSTILSKVLWTNLALWIAILGSAILQLVVLLVPAFHETFRVVALSGTDWIAVIGASLLVVPLWELMKVGLRVRERRAKA